MNLKLMQVEFGRRLPIRALPDAEHLPGFLPDIAFYLS